MSDSDDSDALPPLVASSSSDSDDDERRPAAQRPSPAPTTRPAQPPAAAPAPPPVQTPAPVSKNEGLKPWPKGFLGSNTKEPAKSVKAPAQEGPAAGAASKKSASFPAPAQEGPAAGAASKKSTLSRSALIAAVEQAINRRYKTAQERPTNGPNDAILDQVLLRLVDEDLREYENLQAMSWPCRASDLRQFAECLHHGRSWGIAGESSTIALDEQNVVEFICSRIGKQIPDLQRTKAVRSLRELVFMHGRVDFAVEPLEDPPARLPADQGPSLSVSRSQFIREAEKRWRVSEILLQDLLVLEEQALRSGAVRLQSEDHKAMRWMRLDLLRLWYVESWAPASSDIAGVAKDEAGLKIPFQCVAEIRSKLQHDQEVWFRWVRALLDCGKVIAKDVASDIFRKLWVTSSGLVELRIGPHGYECFRALFCELNKRGVPEDPFEFEGREAKHFGMVLCGNALVGRRICWFHSLSRRYATGTCEGIARGSYRVRDDVSKLVIDVDAKADMFLVEDALSSPWCADFATKIAKRFQQGAGSASAAGAWDDSADVLPDVLSLVGLPHLSCMAVEVFDVQVADRAHRMLLELIDLWEEVPGALHEAMHAHGGVAVRRLRDVTAQQRLTSLQKDIKEHAISSLKKSLDQNARLPSHCFECRAKLTSSRDHAPRVWKDCRQKRKHTLCKICITQGKQKNWPRCPMCNKDNKDALKGFPGNASSGCYEPYGHVQLLAQEEEAEMKAKEDIAAQLLEEEAAAKRAAEKKKKKKKKKAQAGDEAESGQAESARSGAAGAADGAYLGDDDIDDWDADDADHFTCSISLEIMQDPVFFGDGYSYERKWITDWVQSRIGSEPITAKTRVASPKTSEEVHPILIPNHNLKQAIKSWQAHKRKLQEEQEAGANL